MPVKVISLSILAICVLTTAFSLERPAARNHLSAAISRRSSPVVQHSNPTYLQAAEAAAEVVASEPAAKTGLAAIIVNDNVKLFFNLAVWYLGNVYCKLFST